MNKKEKKRNKASMKCLKVMFCLFLIVSLQASMLVNITVGFAQASEDSATSRINFYNQYGIKKDKKGIFVKKNGRYVPCEKAKEYPYDTIDLGLKVNNHTLTGAAGCSLFSGLHAYQWLNGRFGNMKEQTEMTQKLVDMLNGGRPDTGLGVSTARALLQSSGAKFVDKFANQDEIKNFFDTTNGILYINIKNHYFIAVGYTYHEINGNNTFLLHIVDSSNGSTVIRKKDDTFDLSTFEKQYVKDGKVYPSGIDYNAGSEYWMRNKGISILWGAYKEEYINANTLEFREVKYPATYNCFVKKGGTGSKGFNISGAIVSDVNLVSLDMGIYRESDDYPISEKKDISISKFGKVYFLSLLDNGKDNGQKFGAITEEGSYYWKLIAKDSAGRTLPLRLVFEAKKGSDTEPEMISYSYDNQTNQEMPASRIELNKAWITLAPSETETLKAKVIPSNAVNRNVSWRPAMKSQVSSG